MYQQIAVQTYYYNTLKCVSCHVYMYSMGQAAVDVEIEVTFVEEPELSSLK